MFDVEKRTAVQRVGEAPPATSEARRRVNDDNDDDGGGMMNDGCVHNDVLSIFLIQKPFFFFDSKFGFDFAPDTSIVKSVSKDSIVL